jgi:hypothetical protein
LPPTIPRYLFMPAPDKNFRVLAWESADTGFGDRESVSSNFAR